MRLKAIIVILIIIILHANAMDEKSIKKYMKNYVETKMKLGVEQIDIISTYPLTDAPGWVVHFLSIRGKVKMGDEYNIATINKTVFTKGDRITVNLMKKGKLKKDGSRRKSISYTKLLKPIVPIDAYDDTHFLLGRKTAPHKIVVFSDPYCPYCKKKIVEVVNIVNANPNTYGLYYYHLPLLKIHPAADVTTKAMHIFHKKGEIDNMMKLYRLPIEAKETDVNKILKAIKDKTGVLFTKKQIFSPELQEAMRVDIAMKKRLQVTGTPTIFIDGKWDRSREEYKKYAE